MVRNHHRLNGHKFEQTLGDGDGQEGHGSERVGHDWATEQQQQKAVKTNLNIMLGQVCGL